MSEITLDGFTVKCNRCVISLSKDDAGSELAFSTGECDMIKELVGIALAMERLPTLPEHIDLEMWQIRFHPDDTLSLRGRDGRTGEIPFKWSEGDTVIRRVIDGYNMAMNDRELGLDAY
jgi:hypothetical protein